MYLLDTNHCSQAIAGNLQIIYRLADLNHARVVTSVIVQGELVDMVERSEYKESNPKLLENFLSRIEIYPLDQATAQVYGQLKAYLFEEFGPKERRKRRQINLHALGFGENDLWIAATAICKGLILVSSDADFRRIPLPLGLTVESWL